MNDPRRTSSTDVEMAELQAWRKFLGETLERIEAKVDATATDVAEMKTQLRLGDKRMDAIDDHLEATDAQVESVKAEIVAINADKRSVGALVAGVLSFISTAALAAWVALKGGG